MDRDFWSWFMTCLFGSFVLTCFAIVLTEKPLVRSDIFPEKRSKNLDIGENLTNDVYLPQNGAFVLLSDSNLSEPYGFYRSSDYLVVADPHRSSGKGYIRFYDIHTHGMLKEYEDKRYSAKFPAQILEFGQKQILIDNGSGGSVKIIQDGIVLSSYEDVNDPKDGFFDPEENLIYIADRGNKRILVLDTNLEVVAEWNPKNNFEPNGITVGSNGKAYVTDKISKKVWVFENGTIVDSFVHIDGTQKFLYPGGITTDYWGRVYVSDYSADKIYIFSDDGKYKGLIGQDLINDSSFKKPRNLFFDKNSGRLLVSAGERLTNAGRIWSVPVPLLEE